MAQPIEELERERERERELLKSTLAITVSRCGRYLV
jgi:hypothetical protein